MTAHRAKEIMKGHEAGDGVGMDLDWLFDRVILSGTRTERVVKTLDLDGFLDPSLLHPTSALLAGDSL